MGAENNGWAYSEDAQSIIDEQVTFKGSTSYYATDVAKGFRSGARDALEETSQLVKRGADLAVEYVPFTDWDLYDHTKPRTPIIPQVERPNTIGGKVVEDLTQFGLGFIGAGKLRWGGNLLGRAFMGRANQKGAQGVFNAARQGAVGTFLVANPYEARLADFIESNESIANPVTAYLESDLDDTFMEGKMKAALEDAFLGASIDVAFKLIKGVKNIRTKKANGEDTTSVEVELADDIKAAQATEVTEIADAETAFKGIKDAAKLELKAGNKDVVPNSATPNDVAPPMQGPPSMANNRALFRRDMINRMNSSKIKGDKDKLYKSMTVKEIKERADAAGIKYPEGNKRKIYDAVVDDLMGTANDAFITPKPKDSVTVTAKIDPTGVNSPKTRKMTTAIATKLKRDPAKLEQSLDQAQLYNPKTWSPDGLSDDLANAVGQLSKTMKTAMTDVKGTQSWADHTDATALRVGDLLGLSNNELANVVTTFSKATEDAATVLSSVESIMKQQYSDIYDMVANPKFINNNQFTLETLEQLEKSNMLLQAAQGQETAFGRALNLRKKGVIDLERLNADAATINGKTSLDVNEINGVIKSYGDVPALQEIKATIIAAGRGNYKAVNKAAKQLAETGSQKAGRSFVELFRSMILFNTKTHITNVGGGTIETFLKPIEGYLGTIVNAKFADPENVAARQFFGDQISGLFDSLGASMVMAQRAFVLEKNLLDTLGKVDDIAMNKISSEYWPEAKGTVVGGLLDNVGKVTRGSLRLLGAEDEFFKQINYRSKVIAEARATARGKGLKGKDMDDFVATELDGAFDATGAAMKDDRGVFKYSKALQHAREVTFTQELRKGSFAKKFHELVQGSAAAQMLMPFIRTPTNLLATAVQRTPVLAMSSKRFREALASSDPVIVAEAKGKIATGTMIYGAALSLAAQGKITGSGPLDPAQNRTWLAAGNRPYSVLGEDNKWYSYQRMDPNFIPFALVANFNDALVHRNASRMDKESFDFSDVEEVSMGLVLAFTRTVEDKAYFQGVTNLAAAFTSENPAQTYSMKRFFTNFGGSFVPPAPLQIAEFWSEMVDGQPPEVKEAVSLIEKMQRRWITENENLPTKFNWITGKPVINYGSFTGIPVVEDEDDPVLEELVNLKVGFRGPNKRFTNLGFEMNSSELSFFQRQTGQAKIGGRNLMENLRVLFASEVYAAAGRSFEMTEDGHNMQVKLTRKMISKHVALGRHLTVEEFPTLKKEVVARKYQRASGVQLLDFNR